MDGASQPNARVSVDGKFFRVGPDKFYCKGITYGPFAPNAEGDYFADAGRTAADFQLIKELNANVIRVYHVPPRWLLDLAQRAGLRVLVDVPWAKHLCFLDSEKTRKSARQAVRSAVQACKDHSGVFAFSVANEIPADIVRWSGTRNVERFIDELIAEAKGVDDKCLCTFASFPPTEFLRPQELDFACFNVYLHERKDFEAYLQRLQTMADAKPLMLGEFGMDSFRNGEQAQAEFLSWQVESAFRGGAAGSVVFSFTDDWFSGGSQIEDWAFGVTTRQRQPKAAFKALQRQYGIAPYFPLGEYPRVTVVVATYNGGRTLRNCLQSLQRLNYPDYEVIVVDDGSTDGTPGVAGSFPYCRYVRQKNMGLSAARNAGILAATGKIVAFTDDDCRADQDWLYYLVTDLERGGFDAIGGHNFLPPEDSAVAAAVMASPGGPSHVLISDSEAEHVPGCNMAFYKTALERIGLFDPVFRKAGDDVDVCWRVQEAGLRIGFSHAGFVWHNRRSTVKAYLKQQKGYGEAEGMLIRKHPEHFNSIGGGIWKGRIYAPSNSGLLLRGPVIYRGVFASGFFQRLYTPDPVTPLLLFSGLGYHVFVTLPLAIVAAYLPAILPLALFSAGVSLAVAIVAGAQAPVPRKKARPWTRPLVALMFFLQPIVRGWARLQSSVAYEKPGVRKQAPKSKARPELSVYWAQNWVERIHFLSVVEKRLHATGWVVKPDSGWSDFDFEIPAHFFARLHMSTATETLAQGKCNVRCRIQGVWSLPARILFVGAAALLLLAVSLISESLPWVWMAVPLLPALAWGIDNVVQAHAAALFEQVDGVASELSMVRIEPEV